MGSTFSTLVENDGASLRVGWMEGESEVEPGESGVRPTNRFRNAIKRLPTISAAPQTD